VKLCESSKLNLKIGANECSLTTTLAALENSSRIVRAYLAYYGILGLMGYMISLVFKLLSKVAIWVSSVVLLISSLVMGNNL
jgi:hypothetical protein